MSEISQPVIPTPLVIVTGPPASGKSSLAMTIAEAAGVPLIAKDPIKEVLFDAFGTRDREWSQWLGQATYPLMHHFIEVQLCAGQPVVIEATFGPEIANRQFGELNERFPFEPLQIYCSAPPEVLYSRYAERAETRHPGHVDTQILDEIQRDLTAGKWPPLDIGGRTVTLDTTAFATSAIQVVLDRALNHLRAERGR